MTLEDTFSQEEIEAMSEEEKQAFEAELEGDSDTGDDLAEGSEDTGDETQTGADDETASSAEAEASEEEGTETAAEYGSQESDQQVADQEDTSGEQIQADNQDQQAPPEQPADQTGQEDQGDQTSQQDEQVAQKRQEIQDRLGTLKEQFEEGEISFEDYLDKRDEAKDELRELELSNKVRQEIEETRKQEQQQELERKWQQDQKAFFDSNKDISNDPELLKTFQQQANIKINDSSYDSVSNTDLLNQAAQEARAIRGASAPNSQQQGKGQQTETAQARKRASQKAGEKGVETLSDVPNAAEHEDADAEFSHLDKMMEKGETEKLEQELAKLTPEQEARYLQR